MLVRFFTENEFRFLRIDGKICGQLKFTRTFRTSTDTSSVQADDIASDIQIPWLFREPEKPCGSSYLSKRIDQSMASDFQEQYQTE